MKSNSECYCTVAKHCSEFCAANNTDSYSNSMSSVDKVSCLNCKHFDSNQHCRLDLYDKIAKEENLSCGC